MISIMHCKVYSVYLHRILRLVMALGYACRESTGLTPFEKAGHSI